MPVGLSMLVVGAVGYIYLSSWPAFLAYMKTNPYYQFANYTLSVIPLFILMGAFAETLRACRRRCSRPRAASSGTCAAGWRMAVIGGLHGLRRDLRLLGRDDGDVRPGGAAGAAPLRYDAGFATGTIAVGGTLGILIPPSIILVVYAITTEQNIAKLFMAALVPGMLAALFYCRRHRSSCVRRNPELAPPHAKASGRDSAGAILLRLAGAPRRLGSSSAASTAAFSRRPRAPRSAPSRCCLVGVAAAASSAGPRSRRAWSRRRETSGMIFIILLGRGGVRRLPRADPAAGERRRHGSPGSGLPPYAVIAVLLVFYILLGAVMDELAMILLTLPVFFPIV